ncbi:hypothetical protein ACWI58_001716 [Vibrio fluvialis]
MEIELVSVLVGGAIALFTAFSLEAFKWYKESTGNKRQLVRLLELLYEEVEQIAELIDVDLNEIEHLSSIKELDLEHITTVIHRLRENRIIFVSQAQRLTELPGYLPNQLVRFYNRLQANCDKMLRAIECNNLYVLQEVKGLTYVEAETLKADLCIAKNI